MHSIRTIPNHGKISYKTLGQTQFCITPIGHGLWGIGSWSGSSDAEARDALKTSLSYGCNFFDSAWAYGEGKTDAMMGELLQLHRERTLYVASKIPPINGRWIQSQSKKYEDVFPISHICRYADLIRRSLCVDSIDLLQLHVWDDAWANDPGFSRTVMKLKHECIIKAFGISLNRWEPANGIRALRMGLIDAVQVGYNIFDQTPEDELFPLCRELNIGVIARSPLDEGSLGGKLTPDSTFPSTDWRSEYFRSENLITTLERVDRLKRILPESMSLPEMALRFVITNPVVSTAVVGMRTLDHVKHNLQIIDSKPLNSDLMAELKKHRWNRSQ